MKGRKSLKRSARFADLREVITQMLRRWLLVVVLLAAPTIFLVVLRTFPGFDPRWFSPNGHMVVVSAIAACALFVAAVAVVSATQTPQSGVVWLALGCSFVGLFMVGHGLSTPGALHHHGSNLWVARLPYAALAGFALCLLIAGRQQDRGLNRWVGRHPLIAVIIPMAPATAFVAAVVADPSRFHGEAPIAHENAWLGLLSAIIIASLLVAIFRHGRRWHLGKDPVQLALVLAAAMSIGAVLSFEHGKFAQLSWWDYHAYLFAGFAAAVYAVVVRGRRQSAITGVLVDVFVDDPFAHIVRGYPEALSTLVKAVEVKDSYTHGHSLRTAELAVELGLQMSLPSDRLRIIARGAYLHDLGKIAIPDQILNKPGALTPEERKVVETHPRLGYELASTAPSLHEVLNVILHHHERLDGNGYPAGLSGTAIPLEARVVAVADVWDALTSDRAYRAGWDPAHALAHIEAARDTHFDSAVVDALVRVMFNRGVSTTTDPGVADEAWSAGQTCHEIDHLVPNAA
jgi:HD-GYP domain-containing protein (c-di-GMP phosphodiesterase class II)